MAQTHFGFQTVDEREKAQRVRGVFDSVASRYDVMNDLMSGGLHRLRVGGHGGVAKLPLAQQRQGRSRRWCHHRRERNATVAHDHRGHPLRQLGRHRRVVEHGADVAGLVGEDGREVEGGRRQHERDKVKHDLKSLPQQELGRLIQTLEEEMHEAATDLKFEYAARLRDEINDLRRELRDAR